VKSILFIYLKIVGSQFPLLTMTRIPIKVHFIGGGYPKRLPEEGGGEGGGALSSGKSREKNDFWNRLAF